MAPIAKLAVETVESEVAESTIESVAIIPPSHPLLGSDSSYDKKEKDHKEKSSSRKHRGHSESSVWSDNRAQSMKGFLAGSKILVENRPMNPTLEIKHLNQRFLTRQTVTFEVSLIASASICSIGCKHTMEKWPRRWVSTSRKWRRWWTRVSVTTRTRSRFWGIWLISSAHSTPLQSQKVWPFIKCPVLWKVGPHQVWLLDWFHEDPQRVNILIPSLERSRLRPTMKPWTIFSSPMLRTATSPKRLRNLRCSRKPPMRLQFNLRMYCKPRSFDLDLLIRRRERTISLLMAFPKTFNAQSGCFEIKSGTPISWRLPNTQNRCGENVRRVESGKNGAI